MQLLHIPVYQVQASRSSCRQEVCTDGGHGLCPPTVILYSRRSTILINIGVVQLRCNHESGCYSSAEGMSHNERQHWRPLAKELIILKLLQWKHWDELKEAENKLFLFWDTVMEVSKKLQN